MRQEPSTPGKPTEGKPGPRVDLGIAASTGHDLSAGVVVFLVALPLCLGIALASGAPLFSGILAGVVGGLLVPLISRSELSVSGPAAGLTAIVLMGISQLGSFEAFLAATFLAGLLQLGLGLLKAGGFAALVPLSVIRGMLTAIGLILILKQLPHAIGYDVEAIGMQAFATVDGENTFSLLADALGRTKWGALLISAACMAVLVLWPRTRFGKVPWLPSALLVAVLGVALNAVLAQVLPRFALGTTHLVALPAMSGPGGFLAELTLPDWSAFARPDVYTIAVTIALVASIETLLCIEAVDRLDPWKRSSPMSRELVAQGVGNAACGLIGGIPITSVIVRSSTAVHAGGRTRMTAFYHGVFLLVSVMFFGSVLALIPLAALAAILLQVGYKLAHPSLFRQMYRAGWDQFVPFAVTVVAILLTDLLRGVVVGMVVGIAFTLRNTAAGAFTILRDGSTVTIRFNKDQTFIQKPALSNLLRSIGPDTRVIIDGQKVQYLDLDIKEILEEFQRAAPRRGIKVELRGLATDARGVTSIQRPLSSNPVRVEPEEPSAKAPPCADTAS
jgi:MFS superfamily sulfate permease-like transporter